MNTDDEPHNSYMNSSSSGDDDPDYLEDIILDPPTLKNSVNLMIVDPATYEALKAAERERDDLRAVVAKLTDLGDGCYVLWRDSVPRCAYCSHEWDRHSEGDAHAADCPIPRARAILETQNE